MNDIMFYRVIPFSLVNAGATYRKMVKKLFKQKLCKNMEACVDDMPVKSIKGNIYATDLRESFKCMRKHNVHLNSTKCAFGVKLGKFLGLMVSERGIDTNP